MGARLRHGKPWRPSWHRWWSPADVTLLLLLTALLATTVANLVLVLYGCGCGCGCDQQ